MHSAMYYTLPVVRAILKLAVGHTCRILGIAQCVAQHPVMLIMLFIINVVYK